MKSGFKTIIHKKSNSITYTGMSSDRGATTAQAKWFIVRALTKNGITTELPASAKEDKIFDDREDGVMFPDPVLIDTESLLYDGVDDEVNFGDTFLYDHSNQWSLEVWVNPDNLSATRNIFAKSTPDGNVYGVNLRHTVTTGVLFLQMRAAGSLRQFTFNTALTVGWQHLVFTFSGNSNINGARVYRNAVVGNTPTSGAIVASMLSGQDFTLGARNGVFEFSGKMNQFVIWKKALSQSEVTTRYNSGASTNPSFESFSSDLVTWCPIGSADEGDSSTQILDNVSTNHGTLVNFSATPYSTDIH